MQHDASRFAMLSCEAEYAVLARQQRDAFSASPLPPFYFTRCLLLIYSDFACASLGS